jgi:four helix bundle protein
MASRNYRDLIAWQKAMDLVAEAYRSTRTFPREELYALSSQMRRAGISIASNIAEGQGRGGAPELVRFLRIAYGSLRELETQFLIAERLGYANATQSAVLLEMAGEVGRLINGLIRSKGGGA